eukprot:scaffold319950_cov22-Tisochrysis_lutea.AAC.1
MVCSGCVPRECSSGRPLNVSCSLQAEDVHVAATWPVLRRRARNSPRSLLVGWEHTGGEASLLPAGLTC